MRSTLATRVSHAERILTDHVVAWMATAPEETRRVFVADLAGALYRAGFGPKPPELFHDAPIAERRDYYDGLDRALRGRSAEKAARFRRVLCTTWSRHMRLGR
jgi:hypothetical protein